MLYLLNLPIIYMYLAAAGLAQSVERLTAEWEVTGSISATGAILRVFKTSFLSHF